MVFQHQWPLESCRFHDALVRAILAREAADPGLEVSNVGGWHSRPELQGWEHEVIQPVIERIACAAEGVGSGGMRVQLWANVMRAGACHLAHRHGDAAWSGVYYVAAGDPDSGGTITFAQGQQSQTLAPQAGLMLMFPGDLLHSVSTYVGRTPRISVAFNLSS